MHNVGSKAYVTQSLLGQTTLMGDGFFPLSSIAAAPPYFSLIKHGPISPNGTEAKWFYVLPSLNRANDPCVSD